MRSASQLALSGLLTLAACDPGLCQDLTIVLSREASPVDTALHGVAEAPSDFNRVIAVGDAGVIITHDSDAGWTLRHVNEEVRWRAVELRSDGVAVVVGDSGMIARSDDRGVSWAPIAEATDSDLHGLAVGVGPEGRWVAVGDGEILVAEASAESFAPVELPPGVGVLRGVSSDAGGGFIAIGDSGQALQSADDLAWTWLAEDNTADFVSISREDGRVLDADGRLYTDPADAPTTLDLIGGRALALDGDLVAGEDGWIYRLRQPGSAAPPIARQLDGVGSLRGIDEVYSGGFAVGDGGAIVRITPQCVVDG